MKRKRIIILGIGLVCSFMLRVTCLGAEERQWYLQEVGANDCWEEEEKTQIEPVVVAVIDTGIDLTHPALKNSLWINEAEKNGVEGVDDDGNGYVDDIYGYNVRGENADVTDTDGHGSHIAGIIAMKNTQSDNGVGVFPQARIMAIKTGNSTNGFSSKNIIKAINYAVKNGADVINLSLGTGYCSDELRKTMEEASKTAVIVAAAGNSGLPTSESNYKTVENMFPAGLPDVIGVMSYNRERKLAYFSNWDYKAGEGIDYEVIAPGEEIYSTYKENGYRFLSGTSMSAAMVSAVCAEVVSEWRQQNVTSGAIYSPQIIRECVINGSGEEIVYEDKDGAEHRYRMVNLQEAKAYLREKYRTHQELNSCTGSAIEEKEDSSLVPKETEFVQERNSPVPKETEYVSERNSPLPKETEFAGQISTTLPKKTELVLQTSTPGPKNTEVVLETSTPESKETVSASQTSIPKPQETEQKLVSQVIKEKDKRIVKEIPILSVHKGKRIKCKVTCQKAVKTPLTYKLYLSKKRNKGYSLFKNSKKNVFWLSKEKKTRYCYVIVQKKIGEQIYTSKKSKILKLKN